MKSNRLTSTLFSAFLLLAAGTLTAQDLKRFDAQPGSKVTIDGTGNIHDWTVEGQIIGGHLDLDSNFLSEPQKAAPGAKVKAKVDASIPVRSIKSGKKTMDEVMHDAMHQAAHPKVEYHLKELTLKEAPKSADGPFQFESVGDLTISGVTNSVKMPVTIERLEKAGLKTTGTTSVKMTSFGIKPPSPKLALGLITTGDEVKIKFEWLTGPAEK
jgi:hypothetical protein